MENKSIAAWREVLKKWREETEVGTVGALEVFLIVASSREPIPQMFLREHLVLGKESAAWYVKQLSQRGLGLIEVQKKPDDWRENVLSLSTKGKNLAKRLEIIN